MCSLNFGAIRISKTMKFNLHTHTIKPLFIILLIVLNRANCSNTSICHDINSINRRNSGFYPEQNENQKSKLHILHIACKDLRTEANFDAESSTDFAAELVNNKTDLLSGYEVVVHTRFVYKVGSCFCLFHFCLYIWFHITYMAYLFY